MKALFRTLLIGALSITVSKAATVIGTPFHNPSLGGNTATSEWSDLSGTANPGYPGYPGSGAWPSAIAAQSTSGVTTSAGLNKISGNVYPGGSSLYHGGFSTVPNTPGGTLAIQETSALNSLQTIVLQMQVGGSYGYDFLNDQLPVLSFNGGTQQIEATYSAVIHQIENGEYAGETIYVNTYALQWDVSGIGETINDFEIEWTNVQHTQFYGAQLDQSDSTYSSNILPAPVPEPATSGLAALGGLMLILRRKRD